jgi:hypothetical protein
MGLWDDSEQALRDEVALLGSKIVAAINALPAKTAEKMAYATYRVLKDACVESGQDPKWEVSIKKPGEPRHYSDTTCWCVCWEAGPYQWAIPVSMDIVTGCGKLAEPYYSFDLCFYPGED